jgi:hypothetical protein
MGDTAEALPFTPIDVGADPTFHVGVHYRSKEERVMEVVRLPVGKQAPVDTDCIRIEQVAEATFKLTASALCDDADEGESVSIVDMPTFENAEKAEAAGITWAENVGVERLIVSTGTLEQPLELIEIDKPL